MLVAVVSCMSLDIPELDPNVTRVDLVIKLTNGLLIGDRSAIVIKPSVFLPGRQPITHAILDILAVRIDSQLSYVILFGNLNSPKSRLYFSSLVSVLSAADWLAHIQRIVIAPPNSDSRSSLRRAIVRACSVSVHQHKAILVYVKISHF